MTGQRLKAWYKTDWIYQILRIYSMQVVPSLVAVKFYGAIDGDETRDTNENTNDTGSVLDKFEDDTFKLEDDRRASLGQRRHASAARALAAA